MKGGKRDGAGRPPTDNPTTKLLTVKVTARQHSQFLALGGSRWIKRLLDESLTAPRPGETIK
jgi:hypothetical protein